MRSFDHISGKYFDIDDAKIYCEVIGDEKNPVLLFLHGALGNIEDFNNVIAKLPNKFRIIGIDSRGHGKSTLGSKELTYELLQKDVEIILKQLNITELIIIGFSNGGTIAYRLASFSNLKIDKLITIGAPWCNQHVEHLIEAYSKLTSNMWKKECPSVFDSYIKLNPLPEFDALFKQSIKMALDFASTGRPNEFVKNISCPSLIIRGDNDPIVSSSNIVELSKLIKGACILSIPLAGHEAFQDQLEALTTELNKFIGIISAQEEAFMTSKEKNSKDKKLEIIHAARDFFLNNGYEKTTMEDIIAKLDIPDISVHHHFKSKDELLEAVIEDFVSGYIEKLKIDLDKTKGNALERIRILRAADKNFVKEHKKTLEKLHTADNVKFHTWQLAVACTKMASLFAEIIEQGCKEGVFTTDHPLESAEFLLSGIQFLTDDGVYPWKGDDLTRRAKAIPFVLEAQLQAPKGSLAFLAR